MPSEVVLQRADSAQSSGGGSAKICRDHVYHSGEVADGCDAPPPGGGAARVALDSSPGVTSRSQGGTMSRASSWSPLVAKLKVPTLSDVQVVLRRVPPFVD